MRGLLAEPDARGRGAAGERRALSAQFNWSGYTWKVRLAARENPGNNAWGDSKDNVRVRSDGSLRFGITTGPTWRSVEIAGTRALGYGRYRWVVDTDLSNPSQVFALFVRDMAVSSASRGEQDIEFSRWSDPTTQSGLVRLVVEERERLQQLPDDQPRAVRRRDPLATRAASTSPCATPPGRS